MPAAAILCVDDEPIILECLKEQLRRRFGMRYLYETAGTAEEAWDVIDELRTDGVDLLIIVSDWLMPGIKGDEFLAQVHQWHPKIRTIMLTGQADEAAIAHAYREANLYAHFSKPWGEDALLEAVAKALS